MLAAAAATLISAFLHFHNIGNNPPGLFVDEASIAYNAYSILETGRDEHGAPLPLFFRCFGNYEDPVMVYSVVPFVKLLGLTRAACRIPSGIYALLAACAFFFLALFYTRDKWISLAGAFVFSLLPWSFPLSRSVFSGYTPMLLGMTAGCYLLLRAVFEKSRPLAVAAGLAWAFAMYSHNVARPISALYIISFALIFNMALIKRWKVGLTFAVSLVLAMVPMIVAVANNPASLTARFSTIAVWKDHPSLGETIAGITIRYLDYFNPIFLFLSGDSNPRHNTGASGELFVFMAPFIMIGIYFLLRHARRHPERLFPIACVLVYPAAAILTSDRFHATRTLHGCVFWTLLAVIGADTVRRRLPKRSPLILLGAALFAAVEMTFYFKDYFEKYPQYSAQAFLADANDALAIATNLTPPDNTIYISPALFTGFVDRQFKPRIYALLLFADKTPPPVCQQEKGAPPNRFVLFTEAPRRPGTLVTVDKKLTFIPRTRSFGWVPNSERLPRGAKLLHSAPYNGKTILIYKIPPATPLQNY